MPTDPVGSRGLKKMGVSNPEKGENFKEGRAFLTLSSCPNHSDGDFFWGRMGCLVGREIEGWNT